MSDPATNLKKTLDKLDISNIVLAKTINVDPSLISRWLNGRRQLRLSSETLPTLSDFLINKIQQKNLTDWLIQQLELDGLAFDYTSSSELQKGLKIWLASDGHYLNGALDATRRFESPGLNAKAEFENRVFTGFVEISAFLHEALEALPDGSVIDIHLSSEDAGILLHDSISKILFDSISKKEFLVRLIISLTSNTMAMSRLLSHHIQAIVDGLLTISVLHGAEQAIMNQSTMIIGNDLVFIVNETPRNIAPPIGTPVYETSFLREARKSFERMQNFSQPLYQRYNDDYSRNILDIFQHEYTGPGNLDVVKDNINPLFMRRETYDRVLKLSGFEGEQFTWRSAEMGNMKQGMDENMKNDTVYREIISLTRLKQIVAEGTCKMPGLYFMNAGIMYLDAPGCLAVIEGYINYLELAKNFHLIILDELPMLNENCCWHIKQSKNLSLNGWTKDEHIILYTSQLMIIHEFQMIYNDLWNKEIYSEGKRKKTIQTLQEIAEQLKRNHNL